MDGTLTLRDGAHSAGNGVPCAYADSYSSTREAQASCSRARRPLVETSDAKKSFSFSLGAPGFGSYH
eukprot:3604787-Prymnesium_polylepis.1